MNHTTMLMRESLQHEIIFAKMRAAEAAKLHKEALKRMLIPLPEAKLLTKSVKLRITNRYH